MMALFMWISVNHDFRDTLLLELEKALAQDKQGRMEPVLMVLRGNYGPTAQDVQPPPRDDYN